MKFVISVFMALFLLSVVSFAQVPPAPVGSPAAVIVAPPPASPGVFGFLKANLAAVALAVYAILDVAILLSPTLAGNGLVHQILILAGKASGQTPPAA